MARAIQMYHANFIDAHITCDHSDMTKFCNSLEGESGILWIYESENKKPGALFVVFESSKDELITSIGKFSLNAKEELTVVTQQEQNTYRFQLLGIDEEQRLSLVSLFCSSCI